MGLGRWLKDQERRVRRHFDADLTTPENRRKVQIYTMVFDHALLRTVWTNFNQVAPGVYRSNHPTRARFEKMKDMGIKTILTLRGDGPTPYFRLEQEICQELGLTLATATLYARAPAPRDALLDLIDKMRHIEKPFVMHCKSGADRAGLASAIYLMVFMGEPVETARRMLSPRYMHLRVGPVAVLDYVLDCYAARNAVEPIGFEEWVATEYDHKIVRSRYAKGEPPA